MDKIMNSTANQFDTLNSDLERGIVMGRLEALKDLSLYIDSLRESYTRLLVVNRITEEQYKHEVETGKIYVKEEKPVDRDGDEISFDNC